jgi:hypothetical protein
MRPSVSPAYSSPFQPHTPLHCTHSNTPPPAPTLPPTPPPPLQDALKAEAAALGTVYLDGSGPPPATSFADLFKKVCVAHGGVYWQRQRWGQGAGGGEGGGGDLGVPTVRWQGEALQQQIAINHISLCVLSTNCDFFSLFGWADHSSSFHA